MNEGRRVHSDFDALSDVPLSVELVNTSHNMSRERIGGYFRVRGARDEMLLGKADTSINT